MGVVHNFPHAKPHPLWVETRLLPEMDIDHKIISADAIPPKNKQSNVEKQNPEARGVFADIILNAVEPGTNLTVLIFLNVVFVLLLATLAGVSVFTGINIHVIILSIITLGLCVGFNL